MADLPIEKLHEIFEYREGELYWKERPESDFSTKNAWSVWNSRYVGKMAGNINLDKRLGKNNKSYKQLKFQGIQAQLHRVIFAMHYGYYPEFIDHIDGDGLNNRIENLRPCNRNTNGYNQKINTNNVSGYKNVCWSNSHERWVVGIRKNGKKYTKHFKKDELDEAVEYARELREKLHGDYARHE